MATETNPGGFPQQDLEDDEDELTTGTTVGTELGTTTGDGHPPRTNR
ncbi:MAG TPA: hypothetical protein VHZ49_11305 [Methylomirabilota bacterium]|jgi:hypothetical protein|nr:hypothetical protein [Methylomirabilota bacterium]